MFKGSFLSVFCIISLVFTSLFTTVSSSSLPGGKSKYIRHDIPGEEDVTDPAAGHDHGYLMGLPPYENVTEPRCKSAYGTALFHSYECHDIYNLYANRILNYQVSPATLSYLCADRECFSLIRTTLNNIRGNCSAYLRPGFVIPNLRADFEDILCSKNTNGDYCATILTLGVSLSGGSHDIVEPPSMDSMGHTHKRSIEHDDDSTHNHTTWNMTTITSKLTNANLLCDDCTTQTLKRLSDDSVYRRYVGDQLAVQRMLCLKDGTTSCLQKTFDLIASVVPASGGSVEFDSDTIYKLAPQLCSSPCAMKVLCCALSADEFDATMKLCSTSPTNKKCYQLHNESISACGVDFAADNITFPSTCFGVCKTKWLQAEDDNGCCLYSYTNAFSPSSMNSLLKFHSQCHDMTSTSHDHGTDTTAASVMTSCPLPASASKTFSKTVYLPNVKYSFYLSQTSLFTAALVRDLAVSYVLPHSSITIKTIGRTGSDQVVASFTITTSHTMEEQVVANTPTSFIQFDYLSTVVTSAGLFQTVDPIYALDYAGNVSSSALSNYNSLISQLLLTLFSLFFLLL